MKQIFENSIEIRSSATVVDRCVTELEIMRRWLNPLLRCEPLGEWSSQLGGRGRFIINIPLLQPTLKTQVIKREPGLIIWEFRGFFTGCDLWECQPIPRGTILTNRFECEIPNPLIRWGFLNFAANFTQNDMREQLKRLKKVAEEIYYQDG